MADKGGIPEKIKIGDQEYSVKDNPELLSLIESARSAEKTKLYGQISELQSNIKVLEDKQKSSSTFTEEQKDELKKLREEVGVLKTQKGSIEKELSGIKAAKKESRKDEDEKAPKGLTLEDIEALLEKRDAKLVERFEASTKDVKDQLTQKEINDYRKAQLEKHDGFIIAKLVPSNLKSVEEVNEAVAEALKESKQYLTKEYTVKDEKGKEVSRRMSISEWEDYQKKEEAREKESKSKDFYRDNSSENTGDVPPPGKKSGDLSGKDLLEKLDELSPEEYEKYRDQIKRQVEQVGYTGQG